MGWKEPDTTEQLTHILRLTFTWETEQKQISSVPGLGECLCSKGSNKFSWLLPSFPFGTCGFYALNYDLNKTIYKDFFHCLFKKDTMELALTAFFSANISCLFYNLRLFKTFS